MGLLALAPGTFNGRFEILYAEMPMGTASPAAKAGTARVSCKDGAITISGAGIGAVTVFDALGKVLYAQDGINAPEAIIRSLGARQQMLIVQVRMADGSSFSKKVIFNP